MPLPGRNAVARSWRKGMEVESTKGKLSMDPRVPAGGRVGWGGRQAGERKWERGEGGGGPRTSKQEADSAAVIKTNTPRPKLLSSFPTHTFSPLYHWCTMFHHVCDWSRTSKASSLAQVVHPPRTGWDFLVITSDPTHAGGHRHCQDLTSTDNSTSGLAGAIHGVINSSTPTPCCRWLPLSPHPPLPTLPDTSRCGHVPIHNATHLSSRRIPVRP